MIDLDDSINIIVQALNFQGNQYKRIFEKDFGTFCTTLYGSETWHKNFDEFHKHSKLEVPWETCPYPTGKNELKDYVLEDETNLLPEYVPGNEKWQIDIGFAKAGDILGGVRLFVILRNQKSLMVGR